ncbi:MAG: haloalkane dehalogenase [Pseudomonadota bacterium]
MQTVRTSEGRFENLKDYPFEAHYLEVDAGDGTSLRMHYLDEGQGETILCLHGQPSWSYLYRKMIPILVAAGYRVVAPDLVGFGKSDKPIDRSDYTYSNHVAWVTQALQALDLRGVTLVCQDWGSLIGLRVVAENEDRFARVVLSNGGLPDARDVPDALAPKLRQLLAETPALPAQQMREKLVAPALDRPGFMYWIRHCDEHPDFHPAEVMTMFLKHCDDDERRAWAAPFPAPESMAGARQFPSLVPIIPDDPAINANRNAWRVLESFEKPFLTVFGDSDPVSKDGEKRFIESVPGAKGQAHEIVTGAGHFIQDDAADVFSHAIVSFIKANPRH